MEPPTYTENPSLDKNPSIDNQYYLSTDSDSSIDSIVDSPNRNRWGDTNNNYSSPLKNGNYNSESTESSGNYSSPIRLGNPKKLFQSSNNSKNTRSKYRYIFWLVGLFLTLALVHFHEEIKEVTFPLVNLNNKNSTSVALKSEHDWWQEYMDTCCVIGHSNKKNSDCSASGNCYRILKQWLLFNNQSYIFSDWSSECCYVYRRIGPYLQREYCSFSCLNTKRLCSNKLKTRQQTIN